MERSSDSVAVSPRKGPTPAADGTVVLLDVGGFKFTTTVGTLKKYPNTYFSGLFSGNYDVGRQPDGSIFIVRDRHFLQILIDPLT